jgi:hypothetical protein
MVLTERILDFQCAHSIKTHFSDCDRFSVRRVSVASVRGGRLVARVYDKDMERIAELVGRRDCGGWQDLFREIMLANPPATKA